MKKKSWETLYKQLNGEVQKQQLEPELISLQ